MKKALTELNRLQYRKTTRKEDGCFHRKLQPFHADMNGSNFTTWRTSALPKNDPSTAEVAEDATEVEHRYELAIFIMLVQIAISILLIRVLRKYELTYVPDSIAVVLIGAFTGLILRIMDVRGVGFPPAAFFVILLPPIVFESGFALERIRFFENIGSIFVFAVFGTILSAIVIATGVYVCGQAAVSYQFTWIESFVFGSLISAVDPVATLACFKVSYLHCTALSRRVLINCFDSTFLVQSLPGGCKK